jgi:hypothetical protein
MWLKWACVRYARHFFFSSLFLRRNIIFIMSDYSDMAYQHQQLCVCFIFAAELEFPGKREKIKL